MNKKKIFGCRNWFIKNAIYNMLIEDKDYFGIDAIVYNDKLKLTEEEINIRYKLCNLIKNSLTGETYISNTDIMAVLYKIDFAIVDGKLKFALEHENMIKDVREEIYMSDEKILDDLTLE